MRDDGPSPFPAPSTSSGAGSLPSPALRERVTPLSSAKGRRVRAAPHLVPLTRALLDQVAQLGTDPLAAEIAERAGESYARHVLQPGLCFAALDGGYLLGAGGLVPLWHGRAEAWMQVTHLAERRHLAWATRAIAEFFAKRQRDPAFARIEIYIRADAPWRESFAGALGVTEAHGPMRRWDVLGRDYFLYARVASPHGATTPEAR